MSSKEDLEKEAQGYLSQAEKCLEEAARCAEEGGFSIDFHGGGTYVPSAAFEIESSPEFREKARKRAKEDHPTSWDGMTAQEQEEYVDDYVNDLKYELMPYDYCNAPGWWMPSRNC